jgi:predicted TIM-barrel fold metal-dependent hydrolase
MSARQHAVLWNTFKRIAASYSEDEKSAMFHDTAARIYRLPPIG